MFGVGYKRMMRKQEYARKSGLDCSKVVWMEKIGDGRLTKSINSEGIDEVRGRERPKRRWTEGVKELIEERGSGFLESERRIVTPFRTCFFS